MNKLRPRCCLVPLAALSALLFSAPGLNVAQGQTQQRLSEIPELRAALAEVCRKGAEKISAEPPKDEEEWWSTECGASVELRDDERCKSDLEALWHNYLSARADDVREAMRASSASLLAEASGSVQLRLELVRVLDHLVVRATEVLDELGPNLDLGNLDLGANEGEGRSAAKNAWSDAMSAVQVEMEGRCASLADASLLGLALELAEADVVAATREQQIQDLKDVEQRLLAELGGQNESGFGRVVECRWMEPAASVRPAAELVCLGGLRLGGQEASVIKIVDLSPKARVTVLSAEEVSSTGRDSAGEIRCPGEIHEEKKANTNRYSCDQVLITGDSALVAVHLPRAVKPSYGPRVEELRRSNRLTLSVVLKGKSPVILVRVKKGEEVASAFVPVAYQRWAIESGGFYAVSNVTDHELVTVPDEAIEGQSQARVLRIANEDDQSQESGLFINFIPRNYQSFGFGLGFAVASDRAPTIFFGPTLRLRTLGERGLAAVWGGWNSRYAKRFPGVVVGDVLPAGSPLLDGDEEYKGGWFLGVQLGFSFGPIQTGD